MTPRLLAALPVWSAFTLGCVDTGGSKGDDTAAPDTADDTPGVVDADNDGSPAGEDCDDDNPDVAPGAVEACDGLDNDCDGQTDEDGLSLWYADTDGDGDGDPGDKVETCAPPAGFVASGGDCDDRDPAVSSTAAEVCDGRDNDCDSLADDDDDSLDRTTGAVFYVDVDGDGYGDPAAPVMACAAGSGLVANPADCNDGAPEINPEAEEICDSLDNDCNTLVDADDPGLVDGFTVYADADADGYGDDGAPLANQCSVGTGYALVVGDCDDTRDDRSPALTEACGDDVDNNCDYVVDEDCFGCDELRVIQYYDSFTRGSTPFDVANLTLGTTLSSHNSESAFNTAFDTGTWDIVIVDVPGNTLPSGVTTRLASQVAASGRALLTYWFLGYDPAAASAVGVTTGTPFEVPLPLTPASGSALWSASEALPATISNYSHDAGINGAAVYPVDAATSTTLGLFDGDTGLPSILATNGGNVIVNGFLTWDFQSTDDDTDGQGDMAELYINEIVLLTGCTP